MEKINTIDLFAGCGGLCEGFEMDGRYTTVSCVEWEKRPCENLAKHLKDKWKYEDTGDMVLQFDIQRTEELFNGWDDEIYGKSEGLDNIIGNKKINLIVGGPPCQAYSIAGRVRDKEGMRNDYRNYLFESYIKVVGRYRPSAFVFENVPGLLSAKPTGEPIVDEIKEKFNQAGYAVLDNLTKSIVDFSEYGVPQRRNRLIILGLNKEIYGENSERLINEFYFSLLPQKKSNRIKTVKEAIGDLPELYPLQENIIVDKKRYSHSFGENKRDIKNHEPRWHSRRDQEVFALLAKDIEMGENKYKSSEALKKLYTKVTGKESNVHKYHVLEWEKPSNLIPAHLYKDGLRHIHSDSRQARSITVREAARLQGFPDDYEFVGTQADAYKMIGNAVPPIFAKKLADVIYELLFNER